jgi:hypothetical protein
MTANANTAGVCYVIVLTEYEDIHPEEQKHKQGNIPICNDCMQSLYLRGDLALDAHTHTWQFKEDILKKMGPNI